MIHLLEAAREIQEFLEQKGKPFCFIGGLAVLQWGEIRVTNDIDLALLSGYGNEEELIDMLLKSFPSRITEPGKFALANRVLLLNSKSNVPLDITLSGLEYEERIIQRSAKQTLMPGYTIHVCSPEDLIVMKAFANRPKDWADIEGIVLRQKSKLEKEQILTDLVPLAAVKEDTAIVDRLKKLLLLHTV